MEIRRLQPGDEDLLIEAVALTDEDCPSEAAPGHLADKDLVCIVGLDAGEVVGFIYGHILRRFEATSLFIYSVDTAPTHQRQGIAKSMLQALAAEGRTGRWDEMFVFTNRSNAAAMALYASAGGVSPPPDDVVMFDFA
ncbi:GNAT family N-acetyltransferase [Phenylobacterium sp.]|uniref:GNAT family N-acetyltransferase n=1 Tax=Phenylobacterium sp. TaxID=1871053 RepID=UPI002C9CCD42|nr:GNAT family N-acetyltransferase [Phenylobacterium sp.]HLZ75680.1 GNAT family N-acetyltransferase [Phenylobacterium sp.]